MRVVAKSGQERRVSWSLVERVVVLTTDQGPFLPDVFWVIEPIEERALIFPAGATGESEFLSVMQKQLEGFRNDQLIDAMSSTSNRDFVLWERDRHCPRCGHDVPDIADLTHKQRLELRRLIDTSGSIQAIQHLREISGCDLKTAKAWVHHRGIAGQGHEPLAPCPYCGEPLRSAQARQCRFCKRDWHDPQRLRTLGES